MQRLGQEAVELVDDLQRRQDVLEQQRLERREAERERRQRQHEVVRQRRDVVGDPLSPVEREDAVEEAAHGATDCPMRAARRVPGARRATADALGAAHPQRQLELETRLGVVERAAERLAQLVEPVAHGLRVDVERARRLVDAALAVQPRAQASR